MRVLVTGNLGFVGNVLVKRLLQENFEVLGLDVGFYPQGFLESEDSNIYQIKKDLRKIVFEDLNDVHAICHLAALSNDPLGQINPELTEEINFLATTNLAKLAKKANVKNFIFSSSCSSYGVNEELVNEDSNLEPLTAYAKSKVNSEKEILKLNDEEFTVTNLRSATAYGFSNCPRLDLVVNNLTCSAYTTKKVKLLSAGTAWRPLLHVEDMANAFISVLKAKNEKIDGETFNVGSNDQNFIVKEIAQKVEEIIPDSKIEYANMRQDNRSYRVDFSKIKNQLGFKTKWTLEKGIEAIFEVLKDKNFTKDNFTERKYYRAEYIKWLLEQNKVDEKLFFKN